VAGLVAFLMSFVVLDGGGLQAANQVADVNLDRLHIAYRSQRAIDPEPAKVLAANVVAPGTTAATPPASAEAAVAAPAAPRILPVGKGMWLHQLSQAGPPDRVVAQAQATGLTHIFLRLGSSKGGFYDQPELDALLPVAHAAGIKVVGWDFPYLVDPVGDAQRAATEIAYATPDGHHIDAFSADVETQSEGVNISPPTAQAYATKLRQLVGAGYPLIATVPRASRGYPYAELAASFDALAPMVYWMNADPAATLAATMDGLAGLGKPIMPVGQAYDGAIDGGPPGAPSKDALDRFTATAAARGAIGVSFWVWHTATPEEWAAIASAHQFDLTPMVAGPNDAGRVAFLQRVLTAFGHAVGVDGHYAESTRQAVAALQARLGLPGSGEFDAATIAAALRGHA
jgi:hypothetical protein